jgi:hypothetical protein
MTRSPSVDAATADIQVKAPAPRWQGWTLLAIYMAVLLLVVVAAWHAPSGAIRNSGRAEAAPDAQPSRGPGRSP